MGLPLCLAQNFADCRLWERAPIDSFKACNLQVVFGVGAGEISEVIGKAGGAGQLFKHTAVEFGVCAPQYRRLVQRGSPRHSKRKD